MGALQPWHWVILLVVVVLLFGAKRLPDAARSLGKSMRIFKAEVKELQSDDTKPAGHPGPARRHSRAYPSGSRRRHRIPATPTPGRPERLHPVSAPRTPWR